MTLLNIKHENQWDEPNTRNKKPYTDEQWWPLFDALSKLDDGAIISIAVESDKQATQARRGLRLWLEAEAYTAGSRPAFDVKTRLFRNQGGGMKLKIKRLPYGEGAMAHRRGVPLRRRVLPPLPQPAAQL